MKPTPLPVQIPNYPLGWMLRPGAEILDRLGPSHAEEADPDDGLGPRDVWAFDLGEGLLCACERLLRVDVLNIYAGPPDLDRVLDALEWDDDVLDGREGLDVEYGPRYAIWRQDDHGNRVKVRVFPSRREAESYAAGMEA